MKNLFNYYAISNIANKAAALVFGVLISFFLIIAIPLFFFTELDKKEEKQPIVLEMTALQLPQPKIEKPAPKVQTKPKKKIVKKTVQPKKPKQTMLAKVEPDIEKNPMPEEQPPKQVKQKIEEAVQEPIESTSPIPVPIFKLTEAPQFLHREDLIYPELMRSSGKTGLVKLAVLIDKAGNVHRVTVVKSAGEAFDEAAKKALMASTFIPAKIGSKVVAVELRMPVRFRLL